MIILWLYNFSPLDAQTIIISVIAVIAALTMFVFAKLAHHRHVVKRQFRENSANNDNVRRSVLEIHKYMFIEEI